MRKLLLLVPFVFMATGAEAQGCMTRSQCINAHEGYCRYVRSGGEHCWYPSGHRYAERHNPVLVTHPIVRPAIRVHPPLPEPEPPPAPTPSKPWPGESLGPVYGLQLMEDGRRLLQRIEFVPPAAQLAPPPPMPIVPAAAEEPSAPEALQAAEIWPPIEQTPSAAPTLAGLLVALVGASLCGAIGWKVVTGHRYTNLVAIRFGAMLTICGTVISRLGFNAVRMGQNIAFRARERERIARSMPSAWPIKKGHQVRRGV